MIDSSAFFKEENKTISILNKRIEKNGGHDFWNDKIDDELKEFKSKLKNFLKNAQNYECAFCKQKILVTHNAAWDIEHIVSKKLKPNWMFNPKNLILSCKDCNTKKGSKKTLVNESIKSFPKTKKSFKTHNPHFEKYDENILCVESGFFYFPKTQKGIDTIETYSLNRFYLLHADIYSADQTKFSIIQKLASCLTDTNDLSEQALILLKIKSITNDSIIQISKSI